MPESSHHAHDAPRVRCLVLTVSDTRTAATDAAGDAVCELLQGAGHHVVARLIVPDEVAAIRGVVEDTITGARADAVLITGGTGIAARDVTPEAVAPLLSRRLPGFGEALRRLSFDTVGAHGLLSRGFAGTAGRTVVFALPGSPRACRMAVQQLVLPLVGHVVGLLG